MVFRHTHPYVPTRTDRTRTLILLHECMKNPPNGHQNLVHAGQTLPGRACIVVLWSPVILASRARFVSCICCSIAIVSASGLLSATAARGVILTVLVPAVLIAFPPTPTVLSPVSPPGRPWERDGAGDDRAEDSVAQSRSSSISGPARSSQGLPHAAYIFASTSSQDLSR